MIERKEHFAYTNWRDKSVKKGEKKKLSWVLWIHNWMGKKVWKKTVFNVRTLNLRVKF